MKKRTIFRNDSTFHSFFAKIDYSTVPHRIEEKRNIKKTLAKSQRNVSSSTKVRRRAQAGIVIIYFVFTFPVLERLFVVHFDDPIRNLSKYFEGVSEEQIFVEVSTVVVRTLASNLLLVTPVVICTVRILCQRSSAP